MADLELVFGVKEKESGEEILTTLQKICKEIDKKKALNVKINAKIGKETTTLLKNLQKNFEKALGDTSSEQRAKENRALREKVQALTQIQNLYKRIDTLTTQLRRDSLSSSERSQYATELREKQEQLEVLNQQIDSLKEIHSLQGSIKNIYLEGRSKEAHIRSGELRSNIDEYVRLHEQVAALAEEKQTTSKESSLWKPLRDSIETKSNRMKELLSLISEDAKLSEDLQSKLELTKPGEDLKRDRYLYGLQEQKARMATALYKEIEQAKLKYGTDKSGKILLAEAEEQANIQDQIREKLEAQISDNKILADLEQKRLLIDKEIATQKAAASSKVDLDAQKKAADDALAIYKKYSEAKTKSLTAPTEGERSIYADEAKALKEKVELAKQDITDTNTRINLYKKMKDIQAERSVTVAAKAASEQSKATAKEASQAEKTLKEYASRYKEFKTLQVSIDRGERGEAKLSKDLLDAQEADLRGLRERAEEQGIINVLENEEKRIDQELLATGEKLAEQDRRRSANAKNFTSAYAKSVDFLQKYGNTLQRKAPKEYDEFSALTRSFKDKTFEGTSREAVDRVKELIANYTQAGYTVESFGEKVRRIFSDKYVYGVIAVAAMYARNLVREVYRNVQEIDNAMTQLSIVTGQTGGALEASFDRAANSAKKLGSSITDLLGSMETFARLGYDMDQSQMLAEVATMMSKVAAVDIDEATTGLTSIIKGFQLDPEDAEYVGDVLSNIGKKYAVSAGELIEAFERSGAAFKATGTDFEKATALIAAGNAAVDFCRVA